MLNESDKILLENAKESLKDMDMMCVYVEMYMRNIRKKGDKVWDVINRLERSEKENEKC